MCECVCARSCVSVLETQCVSVPESAYMFECV